MKMGCTVICMARKNKSENRLVSEEAGTKQVRLPNDIVKLIEEMVGNKKGAVGLFIADMIRAQVQERHRRWFIERGKNLYGLNVRE